MNRSLYGERDYAFGQRILTLRTQLGLTQTGLAERLGVSRKAVAGWEASSSYPTAGHLQQLIALGVRASAFSAEREAEEIRALWKAARQKVLLDEAWLASLLSRTPVRSLPLSGLNAASCEQLLAEHEVMSSPRSAPAWGRSTRATR